jgi:DNA/RNA-binding domain of Phe-tRNA-synthetase-like protein
MITIEQAVHDRYPTAHFGVLCVEGFHPSPGADFGSLKAAEIARVRAQCPAYDRKTFLQTEPVSCYAGYYKRFKKTYHVLQQFETIVVKGNPLPAADPLVQVLYLTEIKHRLLIAGHDLDRIALPLTIFLSQGGERYTGASGREIELKANDICMRDGDEVILSIIYGQDFRTRMTPETHNALYLIDGVDGITPELIKPALEDMQIYLRTFDPAVRVNYVGVL